MPTFWRIPLVYLAFALAWIVFSDRLILSITSDPAELTRMQNAKGVAFVLLSTLLVSSLAMREHQMAQAKKQREQAFGELFPNVPLPMWIYDAQSHRFLEVNEAAVQKYGYSREQFLTMTLFDIRPSEDHPRLEEELKNLRPHFQNTNNWRHTLANGQVIDVEVASHTLDYQGRPAVLVAVYDVTLYVNAEKAIRQLNHELSVAYDATIQALTKAIDLRDHETEGHSLRVAELSDRLAQAIGLDAQQRLHLRRGAMLHDIGKLGVPDAVLLKPGSLTPQEWLEMKRHPVLAKEWLARIPFLQPALDIPYAHHERWDGSGYPLGLKGEQIPLPARLFAIVDVYDALTSQRPYRAAWTNERALEYIQENAGKLFDPQLAQAFVKLVQMQQ